MQDDRVAGSTFHRALPTHLLVNSQSRWRDDHIVGPGRPAALRARLIASRDDQLTLRFSADSFPRLLTTSY